MRQANGPYLVPGREYCRALYPLEQGNVCKVCTMYFLIFSPYWNWIKLPDPKLKMKTNVYYFKSSPICLLTQQLGYDRKGFLRTGTGNRICSNTIPVLITRTRIIFWHSCSGQSGTGNSNPCSGSGLTGTGNWISSEFRRELTGINFPKNLLYSKSVY